MIFEIFKTGTHTSSNGITKEFTESDLDQIVNSYNPEEHEAPLTIGHPKDNSPAHGWIKKIFREGEKLFAEVDNLTDKLKDALQNKLFKKRSIALYPDFKLRHVGFVPIPSVKGLADIPDAELFALSDDENNLQSFQYDFSEDIFSEPPEPTAEDLEIIENAKTIDISFIEKKLDKLVEFAEKFNTADFIKNNENKITTLNLNLDIAYFQNQLTYKIENQNLLPSVKEKIISIIEFLSGFDFSEIIGNEIGHTLLKSEFEKTLYDKFDLLIDSFPKQNLFKDFAEKPDHEILNPEVFQFAEVDQKSREVHSKAINLMKKENCTYLTAVQKILIDK